jgi:hypothetical protein
MLKSRFLQQHNSVNGPVLTTILVVEADYILRQSRALLLLTLDLPVQKAVGFSDVCELSASTNVGLVAIGLAPKQSDAEKIAAYVRKCWPNAKILLLGRLTDDFYDPLYDEIVDPSLNPSGVIEASRHLIKDLRTNIAAKYESK